MYIVHHHISSIYYGQSIHCWVFYGSCCIPFNPDVLKFDVFYSMLNAFITKITHNRNAIWNHLTVVFFGSRPLNRNNTSSSCRIPKVSSVETKNCFILSLTVNFYIIKVDNQVPYIVHSFRKFNTPSS